MEEYLTFIYTQKTQIIFRKIARKRGNKAIKYHCSKTLSSFRFQNCFLACAQCQWADNYSLFTQKINYMKYSPSKLIEVILYNLNALCAILKLDIVPERGN
jgi:hypothetical protein